MLVLSRKPGEQIVIGEGPDRITLTVVEVKGDKVRLGIVAPKTVLVDRQEVHEARVAGRVPVESANPPLSAAG